MTNRLVGRLKQALLMVVLALTSATALQAQPVLKGDVVVPGRWTEARINQWYDQQPWLVGANYVPRNAINQLEMWQADTFSPQIIDEEFGWAEKIGMNSMRVFLHDVAWRQDPEGFLKRMDEFLAISEKHGIRPMFVFFDDVWNPNPKPGKQPEPRPHLHNSGWVQSPGRTYLGDPAKQDELRPYVEAVLTRFKDDKRILAWDLYNEPGNMIENSYGSRGTKEELTDKPARTLQLLEKAFRWARKVNPSQPLSAGIFWHTAGKPGFLIDQRTLALKPYENVHPINRLALANSDFINFHNYEHISTFAAEVREMGKWNRPLVLTEYLARDNKIARDTNRFEHMLPVAKGLRVAMYNWGFVDGKSQTKYPWDTWDRQWTREPAIWHHDIFRGDGTPYSKAEIEVIKQMTDRNPGKN